MKQMKNSNSKRKTTLKHCFNTVKPKGLVEKRKKYILVRSMMR